MEIEWEWFSRRVLYRRGAM